MGDRHDYVALDWVKGEIEEVLKQAQYELEAYVESPDDTARMKFCLTYLHQVRGTLQMVEFYGAAMLAEEMEMVAQALLDGNVSDASEAREVLMQAILQLPNYLDHVKLGRRDLPVVLLPVLNDLRGSRGEALLSETSLFRPTIQPAEPLNNAQQKQFADKQFLDLIRKLRQMYQVALLGVLKNKDTQHNLQYLEKVSARVAQLVQKTPVASLWAVAEAVLEGLVNGNIAANSAVKELLKQLEPALKNILTFGPVEQSNEDLLKNLLFYVARCEADTAKIARIKKEFNLAEALPSQSELNSNRQALKGPDKATMGSVAAALIEEINILKDKLDSLVQLKSAKPEQLSELLPGFKQISDTMGMLGLGTPRKVIQQQFEILNQFVAKKTSASNTELMDIAGALLYVEASLIGLSDKFGQGEVDSPEDLQLGEAQNAVLKESHNLIENIKELIVTYMGKSGSLSQLGEAADLLMNLRGTLVMVPQNETADIARICSNILRKHVDQQERPAGVLMDALAEALSGVEYYLERMHDNNHSGSQGILDKAHNVLLPFIPQADLAPADAVLLHEEIEDDLEDVDFSATDEFDAEDESLELGAEEDAMEEIVNIDLPLDEAENDASSVEDDLNNLSLEIDEDSEGQSESEEINLDEFKDSIIELNINAQLDTSDEEASIALEAAMDSFDEIQEPVAIEKTAENDFDDDDDLIDDEIIEIFLEEAQEVLETIEEFWPVFKQNQQDNDALTNTRRAFHTLKGSGRMVGAEAIGETAWAIENMFNRLIDNTITWSVNFSDIVDYTVTQVPELISAFENRRATSVEVQAIQDYANQVAKGEEQGHWSAQTPSSVEHEIETPAVEESDDQIESALLEVFSSEVESHLEAINEFIETAQGDDYQTPISDNLQRALHTLKGSAHMAHIEPIADVAAYLEDFAKNLRAYHVGTSAEIVHLFIRGKELIDVGFKQLTTNPFQPIAGSKDLAADVERLSVQLISDFHKRLGTTGNKNVDPQVLNIFLAEGMDILMDAEQILDNWQADSQNHSLIHSLIDEMQTLEKGAQMADLISIVSLCAAVQQGYQAIIEQHIQADDPYIEIIKEAHEGLLNMMDMVAASQAVLPATEIIEQLQKRFDGEVNHSVSKSNAATVNKAQSATETELEIDLDALDADEEIDMSVTLPSVEDEMIELDLPEVVLAEEPVQADIDPELLEIFLEEAQELIDSISVSLDSWMEDKDNLIQVAELQRDLHTFKGGARMAEINAIGDLTHELEDLYEGLSLGRLSATEQLFDLLHLCHDRLADMVQALKTNNNVKAAPELITAIQLFIAGESLDLPVVKIDVPTPAAEYIPAADQPESIQVSVMAEEADVEVVEIFMDEAEELMTDLDVCIQAWQEEPENSIHNEAIQRVLHTFKGGARISGLSELGDLAHEMETELNNRLVNKLPADADLFASLHSQYDAIATRIDSVAAWLEQGAQGPVQVQQPIKPVAPVANDVAPIIQPTAQPVQQETSANVVALHPQENTAPATKVDTSQEDAHARRAQPQEMIKVPAELLDGLVNLAGETSISRGRLENQVTDFSYTLEEMDGTLERLKDQLRRLDIETEAQVLFRQERQGPNYDDFDPLEMDRYSQLQQLSRSLVESASDLMDIKSTLLDKTRDAETLLLQQSRVNTELQEGLMKTRMVPFSRLVPRLRRIVRQVSQELGKQVELNVNNAEGEMDRSVLERLVSPLEHMLRNAVDHGLETPQGRSKAGKPEMGIINLNLSRDGGDVVLRLVDDGAGINLKAVRKKAIERGLMYSDTEIDDQEILQFILQAGFSTAEKVTQISGRGVGMDVVNSEIKQVGGTVVINSVEGRGTEFVIRLPFTVSVNRALMSKVGDALFAIPLNSIEGIVRVSANNLRQLFKQEKPVYHYAGREYQLEYLGNLLRDENLTRLPDGNVPMPVVLVRGAQAAAIQVDSLMGSREIVVKTLGPQFNSVIGVSGGTILGDGSVVIILDLPNMMRHINSLEYKQHMEIEHQHDVSVQQAKADRITSVLVVDDSVTVRKVTTRLLERQGMLVRTAKDGVDAMAILQEYTPDVVLLDIEMPRMDGFEVATQMRHHSTLRNIPIIMITSRTGDKHKERAMSIGVNDYMGKPFQEDKLLASINNIVGNGQ